MFATNLSTLAGGGQDAPAAFWFRETIARLEAHALDLCRGRVLDLGAGAGVHALELQLRGFSVTAIDIVPECVTVMRRRGVQDAQVADLYAFDGGPFDTILNLCNGLDKVGSLADLPRFLARMRHLAPAGQLITDSFDLRAGADATRLAELARRQAAGRYFGESDMRFAYAGVDGAPFSVLHIDDETLLGIAGENGWNAEVLQRAGGQYLARLLPN